MRGVCQPPRYNPQNGTRYRVERLDISMKLKRLRIPIQATQAERQIAAALGLIILFAPGLGITTIRSIGLSGFWPVYIPMAALAGLLGFIALKVYRRNPAALSRAAWAYAFGWAAVIEVFYGMFILATGRVPNKYAVLYVPRSQSSMNFLLAVIWSVVAFGLSRWRARTA